MIDPNGFRPLTPDEQDVVNKLNKLADDAESPKTTPKGNTYGPGSADKKFASAVRAVKADYVNLIGSIAKDQRDPFNLRIGSQALQIWADPSKKKDFEDFAGYANSCNKFVAYVLKKEQFETALVPSRFHLWNRIPSAKEWGDENVQDLGDFHLSWIILAQDGSKALDVSHLEPMKGKAGALEPQFGDIIAYPEPDSPNGHSGFYLGRDLYISTTHGGQYMSLQHPDAGTTNDEKLIYNPIIDFRNNNEKQVYRSP